MLLLDTASVAMSLSAARNTLRVQRGYNERLGIEFWSVEDETGSLVVHLTEAEAMADVARAHERARR